MMIRTPTLLRTVKMKTSLMFLRKILAPAGTWRERLRINGQAETTRY